MKLLTGTWGLAASAVRALLIVARTVTDAKIAVGVGTMTDNPLSNPDLMGQTDWIEDLTERPELSLECSQCGRILMRDVTEAEQHDPTLNQLLCISCLYNDRP